MPCIFGLKTLNAAPSKSQQLIESSSIIYEESFEDGIGWNGDAYAFKQLAADYSFQVVNSPKPIFDGKHAGKFELRYGDPMVTENGGPRAEVLFPQQNHKERWYSYAVYFPSEGWKYDNNDEVVNQWHGGSGTPTLSLRANKDRLRMRIGHDATLPTSKWASYDLGVIKKDVWIEYVFHIIHSDGADGLVEVWENGVKKVTHKGPNLYLGDKIPRWKIGIYKSTWSKTPTDVDLRITYFDNVRIGNELATYNDMIANRLPTPPSLESPANGSSSVGLDPVLKWSISQAAKTYTLQVSEKADFTTLNLSQELITTNQFQLKGLSNGKKYYWRVKAKNDYGESAYSPAWSFQTLFESGIRVTGLQIDPTSLALEIGEQFQLNGTVSPTDATNKTIIWTSSNDKVVSITNTGLLTAISAGEALVTGRSEDGNFTDTSVIKVSSLDLDIKSLVLIDANLDKEIGTITDGQIFSFSEIKDLILSIKVNTMTDVVGSVTINLEGPVLASRTENLPPYSLFGDNQGNYVGTLFPPGTYILSVTAYSGPNRSGTMGNPYTVTFFVEEITSTPLPEKTTLISPNDNIEGTNTELELQWLDQEIAENFQVQVSKTADFSAIFYSQSQLFTTKILLNNLEAGTEYFWRVRASNLTGNGPWSDVWSFKTKSIQLPPQSPKLIAPSDSETDIVGPVTFRWAQSNGAKTYRVQITKDPSFVNWNYDIMNLPFDSIKIDNLEKGVKYFWRVSASNEAGNSNWSSVWSFTTKTMVQVPGTPVLTSPSKDSSIPVGKTAFSWSAVSGAEKYRLQVSKESQFSSPTYDVYNLPSTSLELDIKDGGTYYWRVSASNQTGSGTFSPASPFQAVAIPAAPQLSAPNNQSLDLPTSITLSWAALSNATAYRVQIARVADFSQVVRDVSNISASQLQVDNLTEGVTYYWRVRASNIAGNSSFSTIWAFSTKKPISPPAVPVLSNPSTNAQLATGKVMFTWQHSNNAESYRLQVANDAQFSSFVHDVTNITNTSVELEIRDAGTYHWRVSAYNQAGSSGFSPALSFGTVAPPTVPQLLAPSNQSLDLSTSVLLRWTAISNATSYRVQIATVRDFSQVLRDVPNLAATQLQVDNLSEGVTYFWRIRASNLAGNSSYSTTWEFSTKKALSVPIAPVLTSPSNSSLLPKNPVRMQWQSVVNADDYQIQVSLSSNFSQQILVNQQGITGTSFEFLDLAYNTVYFWRVRARNAAGFGPYSSIRSFRTEAEPQLAPAILRAPAKDGIVDANQVEFIWSLVPDATDYTLYLSQDSLFRSGQSILRNIGDTTVKVADLQREKTYFWKVEAIGSKKASFSEVWKFSIEKEKAPEVFQYRSVDINLYPNPATDFINLSFSEFVSGKVLIQFLDSRGTLVLAREFENVGNELRWDFSGQNIPSGKYFLRIQGEWFVETKQVWIE